MSHVGTLLKYRLWLGRSGVGLGLRISEFLGEANASGPLTTLGVARLWSIPGHTLQCAAFPPAVSKPLRTLGNICIQGVIYRPLDDQAQSTLVLGSQELRGESG